MHQRSHHDPIRCGALAAGIVMVVFGVAMVTGKVAAFSYWLLQTFPCWAKSDDRWRTGATRGTLNAGQATA